MRKNKFNIIIPLKDDNYLAYNPMSNALCKIDQKVLNFLEGQQILLMPETIKDLANALFWVPQNFNEISYIDHIFYSLKYSSTSIGFTIIPTLFCNLKCIYCYETTTNLNIRMDNSITEKVILFIRQKIKDFHPASLHITWYGGEPLLEMDRIRGVSQIIQDECSKRNIEYIGSLVTNGTLLSERDRNFFSTCKIKDVQITMDGPAEIHNLRRPFKDGTPTYDIIMKNILDILNNEPSVKVRLRINIDRDNAKYVPAFLRILCSSVKNWDSLAITFGQVFFSTSSICKSRVDALFTASSFARYYLKILEEMKRLNLSLPGLYPVFNSCVWKKSTNWVIGPHGELYTCWDDIGNEDKTVGDVEAGVDLKREQTWKWTFSNWRATARCLSCPIVPVCLGGCPRRRESDPKNQEAGCVYWRYILKQLLLLHSEKRESRGYPMF